MPTAIHRFTIGDIDAVAIADDFEVMPTERFNGIFNRPADEAIRSAFGQLIDPIFSFNCLYLHTPTQHILIDTGEGLHQGKPHGFMREGLQQAGVQPNQIDTLIITHFHIDHIGGMIDDDGALVFPKARLVVPRREWENIMREDFLATLDEYRAATLRRALLPYEQAGQLDRLDEGAEIAAGIHFVALPGHTPGHAGVSIASGGARLLDIADTVHVPLQLCYLDSIPRFDRAPEQAIETRRAVLEQAVREGTLLMAFHFPFPGLGHVMQQEGAFVWQPLEG